MLCGGKCVLQRVLLACLRAVLVSCFLCYVGVVLRPSVAGDVVGVVLLSGYAGDVVLWCCSNVTGHTIVGMMLPLGVVGETL